MINGMDIETARRYINVMDTIHSIVDAIYARAQLMGQFSECEEGSVDLQPSVVGYFGKSIAYDVLRINELLDNNFASYLDIKLELEALKDDETQDIPRK